MNIADGMGRLSARIRLPWEYNATRDEAGASVDIDRPVPGRGFEIKAGLNRNGLVFKVIVQSGSGETLDAFLDRARAAVVALLEAMPESLGAHFTSTMREFCPHLAHKDPRAGRAGACPDCGAVIGGEL